MARVLLAVPTFESVTPDTFKALWDMDRGGNEVAFECIRGYDCANARNKAAQLALDGGFDYLMMVDSDVTVPPDALTNLMGHGAEVAMGFYAHRGDQQREYRGMTCACRLLDESGAPYFGYPLESEYSVEELRAMRGRGEHAVAIHGGGMGCVLIDVRVFHELRYPWFYWLNHANDEQSVLSEDLYFCEGCRNEGIPIVLDTRVACGHLFRHVQQST